MKPFFFDIETIPGQRADIIERFNAQAAERIAAIEAQLAIDIPNIRPPATYKDQDKIIEWLATTGQEKRAKLEADAEKAKADALADADLKWRRTALNGGLGQVAVIGFAVGDAAPVSIIVKGLTPEHEAEMLRNFWTAVQILCAEAQVSLGALRWVGHNSIGFDARFLWQRCVVLGVEVPRWFPVPGGKPWETAKHYDTMLQWAGVRDRISMNDLCFALGLEGKGSGIESEDIDGAKVWDYVRDGRIEEVATYCEGDVARTQAMYRRMVAVQPNLLEEPQATVYAGAPSAGALVEA